ncbi:MAG: MFS transporter [Deltaproteobacteria bacterium]
MLKKRSVIAVPTFFSLGLMGSFHAFWGTTLPVLRTFLDINIEQATVLTAYNLAAQAVACMLGGLLSDLMRRDKILLIGCLLLGSGAFILGGPRSYVANIILVFWMGLGCGLMLSSSNALLVGLFPDRKGTILNIHHSVYGAVSLISPLVMAALLQAGTGWQRGYVGLGWVLMAVCNFFLFTTVPTVRNNDRTPFLKDARGLFSSGNFVPLLLIATFAVGAQIAVMFLAVTYLVEAKGLNIIEASTVLSAFFVCIFAGRIICSWMSFHMSSTRIVLILLFLQLAGLLVAWQASGWLSAIAVAISGLGCSGIFPSLLALTGTLFFNVAGTSLGVLASTVWIGGMFIVWMAGLLSQRVNVQWGFVAIVLASLAGVFVHSLKYRTFLRAETVAGIATESVDSLDTS